MLTEGTTVQIRPCRVPFQNGLLSLSSLHVVGIGCAVDSLFLFSYVLVWSLVDSGGLVLGYYGNEFTRTGITGAADALINISTTVSTANTTVSYACCPTADM